jgi:ABC-type polysaccharide/polyol phosphate export permease
VTAIGAQVREVLAEQIEFRELFLQMATRDLLLRYKQTAMGFGWALLMPLLNTAIFSVVFMRVAPVDTRVPYPLFAFCGLLAWNFTAASLRFSVTSLTSNTSLVTKVYFPRELFPFAAVAVSLVDTAVASVVLIAMLVYYGIPAASTLLVLPAVVAVQVAFTAALALLLSMANLFYRDVKYLFDVLLTVWMFASAVVYPVEGLGGLTGTVMRANPMTGIIEAYRSVLLYGTLPDMATFGPAAVLAFVLLPAAWLLFHRLEFQFAENI